MAPERSGMTGSTAAKELLMADYKYLADSFWRNEQTGETRVNWFIGIVTAASGGLVALTKAEHGLQGAPLQLIVRASLFALIAFGFVTLMRIIKRNETTDGYKRDMDSIRQIFKDHFDPDGILLHYRPFNAAPSRVPEGGSSKPSTTGLRRMGGLTHTVAVINSLLVSGLIYSIIFPNSSLIASRIDFRIEEWVWTSSAAILSFVLSFIIQAMFIASRERKNRRGHEQSRVTHAGGIVYTEENGRVYYLLVGPKKDEPDIWLLPKGHLEKMEGYGEAAIREVQEETGVVAKLVVPIGNNMFTVGEERTHVVYYLMEGLFETDRPEIRRTCWFTVEEALKNLTHAENRRLLHEAELRRATLFRSSGQLQSAFSVSRNDC